MIWPILEARAEIQKYFRSFFGSNKDIQKSFYNYLTFSSLQSWYFATISVYGISEGTDKFKNSFIAYLAYKSASRLTLRSIFMFLQGPEHFTTYLNLAPSLALGMIWTRKKIKYHQICCNLILWKKLRRLEETFLISSTGHIFFVFYTGLKLSTYE